MTRYLISFDDGAMTFPVEEGPAVGEAAHAVVRAAQEAGVWIFGGGVENQRASIVATGRRPVAAGWLQEGGAAPTPVGRVASAIALQMCARWRDGRGDSK